MSRFFSSIGIDSSKPPCRNCSGRYSPTGRAVIRDRQRVEATIIVYEDSGGILRGANDDEAKRCVAAIAQAKAFADNRDIAVTAENVGGQAIAARLVDEVHPTLVPVFLGSGVRFFGDETGAPALLDDPEVIPGHRVTHLMYRVHKS